MDRLGFLAPPGKALRGSNWAGLKKLEVVFPSLLVPVADDSIHSHSLVIDDGQLLGWFAAKEDGLAVFLSRSYRTRFVWTLLGHYTLELSLSIQHNTATLAPNLAHAWDNTDRQSGPFLGRLACSMEYSVHTPATAG
jgi:hypothetical protein